MNDKPVCPHQTEESPIRDWRECWACVDMMSAQLVIARAYLKELALATFNDDGVCVRPVAEPVQARHFQAIAATGLSASS